MKAIALLLSSLFLPSVLSAEPTILDYGRRCAEELGVEVPRINCLDPRGTLLPVGQSGTAVHGVVEQCDKPALLHPDKACIPGNRLFKYRATNARGETVVTMVLCRRMRQAALPLPASQLFTHPWFQDVGVIQYNETSRKACWYFMEDHQGKRSDDVPRPWSASWEAGEAQRALGYWVSPGATSRGRCLKCHDNGVWIRSPFVTQADGTPNAVPRNRRGEVHHVEVGELFRSWNGTGAPIRIQIDADRWLGRQSPALRSEYERAVAADEAAPAGTCTRCHDLGRTWQRGFEGLGTCGYLFEAAIGGLSSRLLAPPEGPRPWMPPDHDFTPTQWRNYHRYSVAAARSCCQDPYQRDASGAPVCTR